MALQISRAGGHRALLGLWDTQSVLLQAGLGCGWRPPGPGWDLGGQQSQDGAPAMGCTYQCWGASGDGRSGLLAPASGDLKEATALD